MHNGRYDCTTYNQGQILYFIRYGKRMSLMFLDANPPKDGIYGYYTCKKCGKKCDALVHSGKGKHWMCIKCWKDKKK